MSFELDKLVRGNIKQLVPYSSARQEYVGKADILLDANENSFGSPIEDTFHRYPDPQQRKIKERLASLRRLEAEQIFVGNGSDEAIDLLIRIFCTPRIDNIIICPPTYGMYEVSASINDVDVHRADLTAEFQPDAESISKATNVHTKIIFLCSPNNPTGNLIHQESLIDIVRSFNGVVVIDEAYIDFSNGNSMTSQLDAFPNLVVLQTFSKAWGLAGLRVGLAFASNEIIALFNKVKPPYNISQAVQDLVLVALENQQNVDHTVEQIKHERERLEERLKEYSFVSIVYPSDANFLLVKVTDPSGMYQFLMGHGIVIRNRSNVTMCAGCLRITVGTTNENEALLRALNEYETSLVY